MSEKSVPAGKWRLRPFDEKCRAFVDPDAVVEDQIRCRVPLWSGNFEELKPQLTQQNLRLEELPKLTVCDIGQYVIAASQGGAFRCGPVGTASSTIVAALPAVPSVDDELYAWAADELLPLHWQILETCKTKNINERARAQSSESITAWMQGNGNRQARGVLSELQRQFRLLRKHGLLKSSKGVGTWITPKGLTLLETRDNKSCVTLRAV